MKYLTLLFIFLLLFSLCGTQIIRGEENHIENKLISKGGKLSLVTLFDFYFDYGMYEPIPTYTNIKGNLNLDLENIKNFSKTSSYLDSWRESELIPEPYKLRKFAQECIKIHENGKYKYLISSIKCRTKEGDKNYQNLTKYEDVVGIVFETSGKGHELYYDGIFLYDTVDLDEDIHLDRDTLLQLIIDKNNETSRERFEAERILEEGYFQYIKNNYIYPDYKATFISRNGFVYAYPADILSLTYRRYLSSPYFPIKDRTVNFYNWHPRIFFYVASLEVDNLNKSFNNKDGNFNSFSFYNYIVDVNRNKRMWIELSPHENGDYGFVYSSQLIVELYPYDYSEKMKYHKHWFKEEINDYLLLQYTQARMNQIKIIITSENYIKKYGNELDNLKYEKSCFNEIKKYLINSKIFLNNYMFKKYDFLSNDTKNIIESDIDIYLPKVEVMILERSELIENQYQNSAIKYAWLSIILGFVAFLISVIGYIRPRQ